MKATATFLVILILSTSVAEAAEKMPRIKTGTGYSLARQQMIEAGFTPLTQSGDRERCLSHNSICEAFPEVSECLRADIAPCRFEWSSKSGRSAAYIETRGTDAADIRVIRSYILPFNSDPYPLSMVYP